MSSPPNPSAHAKSFVVVVSIVFVCVIVSSLVLDIMTTHRRYRELAIAEARAVSRELLAVRTWSLEHGGIFTEIPRQSMLSSEWKESWKTAKTDDGTILTKVHPEYITKLLSGIMNRNSGITISVTSLKPISQDNAPDAWEKAALGALDEGAKEQFGLVGTGQSRNFRYMSPLITEKACLGCHGEQGFKVGTIRGGIGVSFSYAPFQEAVTKDTYRSLLFHVLVLVTGLAAVLILGKKLVDRVGELHEASLRIKRLEGILPICSSCKKIRMAGAEPKSQESWVPVEVYISDNSDAEFSHGVCPECAKKLYGWEYK